MVFKGKQEVGRKRGRSRERRRERDLEWGKEKKGEIKRERNMYPFIFYHNYAANQILWEA